MSTKNFTQFDLRTGANLNPNDFIVGYKSDGTAELRTSVRSLTAAFGSILRGSTGIQGSTGIGATGGQGATGFSGSTGIQGNIGNQGATGYDFNYTPVTTNINLETNTGYIVNTTTSGALTGTLPGSPSVGHFVNFTINTNGIAPFTIARNSRNINSLPEDLVCDVSGNFTLVYTDATVGWRFIPFAGLTTPTLKTFKAVLSANSFNQTGVPGVSGLQNIENSKRVPYNIETFNSDPTVFGGIQNPSNLDLVSFHIKVPGFYNISSNLHLLDLASGRHLFVQLWQYTATGGDRLLQSICDFTSTSSDPIDQFIYGQTTVYISEPNTYLYLKLSHNIPFPGPYPSLTDTRTVNIDTGTNGPSEIVITKLG